MKVSMDYPGHAYQRLRSLIDSKGDDPLDDDNYSKESLLRRFKEPWTQGPCELLCPMPALSPTTIVFVVNRCVLLTGIRIDGFTPGQLSHVQVRDLVIQLWHCQVMAVSAKPELPFDFPLPVLQHTQIVFELFNTSSEMIDIHRVSVSLIGRVLE